MPRGQHWSLVRVKVDDVLCDGDIGTGMRRAVR